MKFFRLSGIICVVLLSKLTYAQNKNEPIAKGAKDTIVVAITLVDDERIPWVVIPEISIVDTRLFRSPEEKIRYNRLRYNVLKVLPYAMYARRKYQELEMNLANVKSRKEKRIMIKSFELEIKDMFNSEVKNLTITQGGILIKLIDRETGNSSYDLVKDMKGGVTAFVYQSVARLFGNNLKNTYDPQQDRDIETIIRSTGYYSYGYL